MLMLILNDDDFSNLHILIEQLKLFPFLPLSKSEMAAIDNQGCFSKWAGALG